jgi:hypothetical protein
MVPVDYTDGNATFFKAMAQDAKIEMNELKANIMGTFCCYALVFRIGAHYMGFGLVKLSSKTFALYHYDGQENGGYVRLLNTFQGASLHPLVCIITMYLQT